jgi:DNA-binding CsgD family transcriptional regulator
MAAKKLLDLTDGQKECLRLVDKLLTSKEIARKLDISPFTVDQRLDAARRKLNASSRKEAAKIYVAIESQSLPDPLVYQSQGLVITEFPFTNLPFEEVELGRQISKPNMFNAQKSENLALHSIQIILEAALVSVILISGMTLIIAGFMRLII